MIAPWAPGHGVEDRANYTDAITEAILDNSTDTASNAYVSGLEIAASALARAFASATVSGPEARFFDPNTLSLIGRRLVEAGEAIWYREGEILIRGDLYTILAGGLYQIDRGGPYQQVSSVIPADRVFAARWNTDYNSGRGISPLGLARSLHNLMSRLESSMASEAGATTGYLLPIPADGDAGNVATLKQDLKNLNGQIAVVESTRGGWGDGPSGAPRRDFVLARLGADFPQGNVDLFTRAEETILAACGYPVQLVRGGDGSGQREAWRRYLHGTITPLARLVETAARRIGLRIELSFESLFASDIAGRARAFQSLVQAGMDLTEAATQSGLLIEDD